MTRTCSQGPHPLGQGAHGTVCRECFNASRRLPPKPAKPPPPPKSETRLVQGHMQPTEGPRDESCAKYGDCLTAHIRAHRGQREAETEARCPFGCRWYQEQESAPATAYVSLNGEARGLPQLKRGAGR